MVTRIRHVLLGFLTVWFPLASASAQQSQITGIVTDETREPIAGATVRVPDTGYGTLTRGNGRFTLVVPLGSYTVEARSIGYDRATETVTVGAGEPTTVDFVLSAQAVELSEVIASVAATTLRRAEVGTDIERFDAEQAVDQGAVSNVSELLNARAPGVSISQSSGSVGSGSTIRVRGSTSLTQDNNPIIYIDGIRVSNQTGTGPGSFDFGNGQTVSRLDDINPQDIANVQVMKGPTAAALYGSEAAAGVILIETKQGIAGQHRFTFSTEQGILRDLNDYPDNYFNLTRAGGLTDINDPTIQQFRPVVNPFTGDVFARHNPLENPITSPLRTGNSSQYTLSVRGGSEAINYFGSLQYEDQGRYPPQQRSRALLLPSESGSRTHRPGDYLAEQQLHQLGGPAPRQRPQRGRNDHQRGRGATGIFARNHGRRTTGRLSGDGGLRAPGKRLRRPTGKPDGQLRQARHHPQHAGRRALSGRGDHAVAAVGLDDPPPFGGYRLRADEKRQPCSPSIPIAPSAPTPTD